MYDDYDDDGNDDDDDSRTVLSDPICAVLSDPNPVVPSDPATAANVPGRNRAGVVLAASIIVKAKSWP